MIPARTPEYLVSTDLDGTLLDHHSYSWEAAKPAIDYLKRKNIPVIFNTSKTLSEALNLQRRLGINGPVIIENGSALAMDEEHADRLHLHQVDDHVDRLEGLRVYTFGCPRSEILSFIADFRAQHGPVLEGYNDWSLDKIVDVTGLQKEDARHSAEKHFSEPFIWRSDALSVDAFIAAAEARKLNVLRGGRFFHLQGNTTKATPLQWLRKRLQAVAELAPKLICLGDNHNDIHMLNTADFPVCIKSPVSDYPKLNTTAKVYLTRGEGPEGWAESIAHIFPDFSN